MEIKQFYDKNLAHASYAIVSGNEIALIDPARDPRQYYDFAKEKNANIVAVIETHPHADFVSSHAEISKKTGAKIYVSKLLNPFYDFVPFDEGDKLKLGNVELIAMNTPGHSPDSICVLVKDENGKEAAVATGDTLFVEDVGRPDLRESAGSINKTKDELARMMYNTINNVLLKLPDDTIVYPAHGAGSLCGKSTSKETFTTIGKEKARNYALQPMSENDFVNVLLKDQPFVPKYFGYDVELNRKGAPEFEESVGKVERIKSYDEIEKDSVVIDARKKTDFIEGHYKGAINIIDDSKFETWLGSIVSPLEKYYIVSDSESNLDIMIRRAAKIGYELNIKGALVHNEAPALEKSGRLDLEDFKKTPEEFNILDVRNKSEVDKKKIFKNSLWIPLNEVRERYKEIPVDKPLVVHCAGGSRSAAASSILEDVLNTKVFDLGNDIKLFSEN